MTLMCLDTWYSSAFGTLFDNGLAEQTPDMSRYLPSSVLVTGYDIIFLWVARMIMMTTHFTGQVHSSTFTSTGLVRDAQGKK